MAVSPLKFDLGGLNPGAFRLRPPEGGQRTKHQSTPAFYFCSFPVELSGNISARVQPSTVYLPATCLQPTYQVRLASSPAPSPAPVAFIAATTCHSRLNSTAAATATAPVTQPDSSPAQPPATGRRLHSRLTHLRAPCYLLLRHPRNTLTRLGVPTPPL